MAATFDHTLSHAFIAYHVMNLQPASSEAMSVELFAEVKRFRALYGHDLGRKHVKVCGQWLPGVPRLDSH